MKNKVTIKVALWATAIILILIGLYETSPRHFPECQGTEVPRHCVDL